ncbi:8'-apo-carotenoid 13,14-cleaving dioxygenase [Paraburkholderia ultramafica]|uniref:8'-apo-carotenoid 13,14-cleaving dioxygenase n=1 Tax=Paraburkholderia ultramafica TaxID=1544867 RepID=A0A6S7AYW7_9BURK|nr:carotenoid oxygenase family protein [Paraburkholderia ultramafica]CAB3782371.1 8'-apo-carotenoid 13,14-cleaving dioxygenase [Paraburkholderia ultramafica]
MSTEPVNAAAFRNAYLADNFAPVEVETTAFDLKVTGTIPEELTGRLLRIGPNPASVPDPQRYHWFHSTGMAHGLRVRDGKAEWYRSRFVKDAAAVASLGRGPIPGPGAQRRDGPVNTNFTQAGDRLYATVEAGSLPVELDYELESVARSDFGGTLETGFTGHPRFDPVTGEQHALTYEAGEPVRYVSVGRDGRATTRARIDLPHVPLIHDCAFTASFIVVPDLPVTFQPQIARATFPWIWNERQDSRIGLLPRDGDVSRLQWFAAPRCFLFHFVNAYDEGDLTIIDLVRHPRSFDRDHNGPNEGETVLVRWTLDRRSGLLSETGLDWRGREFPRINGRFGGQAYRYAYTSPWWGSDASSGPAMKHDMVRGTAEVHDYGAGRMTLEPVFVRRPDAAQEDDGWIMSYVYDGNRNLSDVVILHAQDFAGDPVATIELPVRVPFGFHGGWSADKESHDQ